VSIPAHRINLVPFFAKLIQEHHGDFETILDVGCGELSSIWRQRWGDKYEGLDTRDTVNADYVGDACDLSLFPSNSRDVVCGWSTLEHVTHPYDMLSEMKRVSKATVIITTDYVERDKNGDPTHLYSWTPKSLRQLITRIHGDCKVYESRNIMIGVLYNCSSKEI